MANLGRLSRKRQHSVAPPHQTPAYPGLLRYAPLAP